MAPHPPQARRLLQQKHHNHFEFNFNTLQPFYFYSSEYFWRRSVTPARMNTFGRGNLFFVGPPAKKIGVPARAGTVGDSPVPFPAAADWGYALTVFI